MPYEHGITVIENPTSVNPPVTADSAVQVVIGTAPIHLAADPTGVSNKPILAYSYEEAVKKLGFSYDFENYSLCESIYASFQLFRVAPVVFINVLDPEVHKTSVASEPLSLNGEGIINAEGVLLNSLIVKDSGGTNIYERNKDYTVAFNRDGKPVVSRLSSGTIPESASLEVSYDRIDPTKVTKVDVIGGYDAETGKLTGSELIQQVFPMYGLVPGLILAPGWTHHPDVAAVLDAKSKKINANFNSMNILDADSSAVNKYEDVPSWKAANGYTSEKSIVCWPKVKVGENKLWYSSVLAALIAYTDAQNENVPYVSPSNKRIPISATILADGTEVYLDQPQANHLNGSGIVTAMNWNGWRTWGNNTAVYPSSTDPKDRFIPIRRVFDWWGNTFILTFFDEVDDPTNYRLIESVVDSENLRANGYQARGQIAGASIEFRQDLNPITDILNGKITFIQKIGAFPPAENIVNILEFDPTIVNNALFGGA